MLRALVLSLALTAATLTGTATAAEATHPAPGPPKLFKLHATHGNHPKVVDARGAQVLLRGVNVNGLGEYFQANPDLAPTVPLTKDDFHDIAALGFNSVRLVVSWSALEPTRGAFDTAYVARIHRAVRWAAAYGLYVVLDMHQDAWGIAVDTPTDQTCPSGTQPDNGWDGAPAWATITDDASTCRPGPRELAPAVRHAWQHFYEDTDGIQGELVRTWGRLAESFARSRAVAGFDLLNEPGIGLTPSTNETVDLGRYYGRAIQAIRAGERRGDGFHHVALFEPAVEWSAFGHWVTPPPGFTDDTDLVFAPHIYAESLSPNSIDSGFRSAATTAQTYGVTVWSGEWGFFPSNPADSADAVERYAAAEDAYGYGGAWWDWKQACGDPHVVHQPGGQPDAVSPSLVRYTCPDQVAEPVDPAFGEVLGRPAPRTVPGRIDELSSDGRTGAFTLAGTRTSGARACSLRVFVPHRFAGLRMQTTGITHLRRTRFVGDVQVTGCVDHRFRISLLPTA